MANHVLNTQLRNVTLVCKRPHSYAKPAFKHPASTGAARLRPFRFQYFDRDDSGELNILELGPCLRHLGYPAGEVGG